jgi:hypothetical protein
VSFRSLLISSALIERETEDGFDDYGNPVVVWDEVTDDVPCRLVETGGEELDDDRTSVTRTGTLFVQAGTDLSVLDRVTVNGATWEVFGPPISPQNSVGVHHIEAPVRLVTL